METRERKPRTRLSSSFEACWKRLWLKARFFSSFIFFDIRCCVLPAHKSLTPSATPQNKHSYSPRTIGGVSSISLLLDRLFALASYHHLSFFSPKISLTSADCLRRNCDGRLHCLLWIFWVLLFHYYHKRISSPKTNLV